VSISLSSFLPLPLSLSSFFPLPLTLSYVTYLPLPLARLPSPLTFLSPLFLSLAVQDKVIDMLCKKIPCKDVLEALSTCNRATRDAPRVMHSIVEENSTSAASSPALAPSSSSSPILTFRLPGSRQGLICETEAGDRGAWGGCRGRVGGGGAVGGTESMGLDASVGMVEFEGVEGEGAQRDLKNLSREEENEVALDVLQSSLHAVRPLFAKVLDMVSCI
jgi:hypothetical protein